MSKVHLWNPAKSSGRLESAASLALVTPDRLASSQLGGALVDTRGRSTRAQKTPETGGDAMGKKTVAELLVDILVSRDVSRVYGVS